MFYVTVYINDEVFETHEFKTRQEAIDCQVMLREDYGDVPVISVSYDDED